MKPGNKPMIMVILRNVLRILNLSLDIQYATDKTKNVEIKQQKIETIMVLPTQIGKAYFKPLKSDVNKST